MCVCVCVCRGCRHTGLWKMKVWDEDWWCVVVGGGGGGGGGGVTSTYVCIRMYDYVCFTFCS